MATTISDECALVDDSLLLETGRIIPGLVLRKAIAMEPVIALVNKTKGVWEDGLGKTVNVATSERMLPAISESTWGEASEAEDECLPPVEKVQGGETLRPVSMQHKAIETADYCIEGIRDSNQFSTFLGNRTKNLAEITAWVLTGRYLHELRRLSSHHITALTSGPVDADIADTYYNLSTPPNSSLTQGLLDDIRTDMLREAGNEAFMSDSANGAPVLPLLIGDELSRQLIRGNEALRQDVRFAYEGQGDKSPLIQAMNNIMAGRRAYGGWSHFILRYPPRYNIGGHGELIRVEPFQPETPATKAKKRPVDPNYKTAELEEIFPYSEDVMKILERGKITNAAPGWTFNAVDMTGVFRWVNEWHRDCNPDRTKGFFRAVFKNAAMPLHPEIGYTILVQRCANDNLGAACEKPYS